MSAKISSIWLIFEKLFALFLSLIVTIFLARYLAPDKFGELNLLISLVALLGPLGALGLNSIITKEVIHREQKTKTIIGTSLALRTLASLLVGVVAIIFAKYYLPPSMFLGFIILVVGQIFQSLLVFDFWIQAKVLNKSAVKARTFVLVTMSLFKLFGIWQEYSLLFFVVVTAVEMALLCICLTVIYHSKTKQLFELSFAKDESINLLKQSWWLLLSGMAAIVYLKIDQVMLGWLSTIEEVGIYAVAARLSEVWYFFPIAIVSSYFPQLLSAKKSSEKNYVQQLQQLSDVLCMSALFLAIATQIIAPWGLTYLFGQAYAESAQVLVIHIWAGVFIFMRALLSKWLIAENLLYYSLVTQVLGAVMNILGNLLFIPIYGAQGAALATIVGYTTASYLALFCNKSTLPMARIMTYSILWPVRALFYRDRLYK